jgi:hypothetical protein
VFSELIDRLRKAEESLVDLRGWYEQHDDAVSVLRLDGKIDGVRLAISYAVDEDRYAEG